MNDDAPISYAQPKMVRYFVLKNAITIPYFAVCHIYIDEIVISTIIIRIVFFASSALRLPLYSFVCIKKKLLNKTQENIILTSLELNVSN